MDVELVPGAVLFGKYRLEGVVGRGGMAEVHKVTHLTLREQFALKVLLPAAAANPEVAARFLREAQSIVRLRSEHVTRVSDVGVLPNGLPFIVMEYLQGVDLAVAMSRRLHSPGELVDYVLQACEALAEAHANDIVHRDIKPSNLFVTSRADGTPLIKVLDFGISKASAATSSVVTNAGDVMGTPGYMSPEQMAAARDVDARTDVWALGVVLYEGLNMRRPFEAETFSATVMKVGTAPPPPMDPRVPRELQRVVLRCLEKDRARRFPSIAALATALAPLARDRRAASMVVDRTSLMLRNASLPATPVPMAHRPPPATTITGSAGESVSALPVSPRFFRRVLVGAGAIALLSVAAWAVSAPSSSKEAMTVPAPGSVNLAVDPGPDQSVAKAADPAPISPTGADAAVVAAVNAGQDHTLKVRCAERHAAHDWKGLLECAADLDKLDAPRAAEYRDVARREQRNELAARDVQSLGRKNVRDAEAALAKISYDSVYAAPAREAFRQAEQAAIDQAVSKAQRLASAHDCAGIKVLHQQLSTTSTVRVAASVDAVSCTEKPVRDAADQPRLGGTSGNGNAPAPAVPTPTLPQTSPAPQPRTAAAAPSMSPSRSVAIAPAPSSTLPAAAQTAVTPSALPAPKAAAAPAPSATSPSATQTATTRSPAAAPVAPAGPSTAAIAPASPVAPAALASKPPAAAQCAVNKVEDLMKAAADQYGLGYAKAALTLVEEALDCRPNVPLYRMAAMYACAAGELRSAQLYFNRVPIQFQSAVVQRCQQEGLQLRP